MKNRVSRRRLLGTAGQAAAGLAAVGLLRNARAAEANETPNLGLISCGGRARGLLQGFCGDGKCRVGAVCDVDDAMIALAHEQVLNKYNLKPAVYKDYRRVLDQKDIDLVVIGTPDHWHAIPALNACAAGKDVYVEKPAAHNVHEVLAMVQAAAKHKRIMQVGTQQRSMPHFREAVAFIRSGQLGRITMTNTFNSDNETPNGNGRDPDTAPPPGLDYGQWLGPAPWRAYNRRRVHVHWRWYFDYGCGMLGDWNVHLQDIVMWAMESPSPRSISASGGRWVVGDDRDTPDTVQAVFAFPGYVQTYTMRKGCGKPWWLPGGYGIEFHGTNGRLHLTRNGWSVSGDEDDWDDRDDHTLRVADFEKPGKDSNDEHIANFLDCVRTRKTPNASIEIHAKTVIACHLANISVRVGRKIFWDANKNICCEDQELKIPDAQANALLGRTYRKGYELPEV